MTMPAVWRAALLARMMKNGAAVQLLTSVPFILVQVAENVAVRIGSSCRQLGEQGAKAPSLHRDIKVVVAQPAWQSHHRRW